MYPIVEFTCEFTAPFHTSEYNYSNLFTCAPYILGSSLRGAVLRALIDSDCSGMHLQHVPTFHNNCDNACSVKPLFLLPTRFSFGEFSIEEQETLRTRVGIERAAQSAAQGALVSAEVRYGAFSFAVVLPDSRLEGVLHRAVEWAGSRPDSGGIGRFRSIGWGRFGVRPTTATPSLTPTTGRAHHKYRPDERNWQDIAGHTRYRFRFCTPYVLDPKIQGPRVPTALLQSQLTKALESTDVPPDMTVIGEPELSLTSLSFIRRWSDEPEHHGKENRPVAGIGSEILVAFAQPVMAEHLQLWTWGIGEWLESGFGSFNAIPT